MLEDTWKGCTPDGKPPVVGKEYRIIHSRKGTFFGRVVSTDATWARVIVTSGTAVAAMRYNVANVGEEVSCRNCLCRMDPVEALAKG